MEGDFECLKMIEWAVIRNKRIVATGFKNERVAQKFINDLQVSNRLEFKPVRIINPEKDELFDQNKKN